MSSRIVSFDYLRALCAVAVVAIHSLDTNSVLSLISRKLFVFAVPVFLMISFYLTSAALYRQRQKSVMRPFEYLYKRFNRLMPPFLIWTSAYAFIRSILNPNFRLTPDSIANFLFVGSASMQLYYIPLLMYFSVLFFPLVVLTAKKKHFQFLCGFCLAAFIAAWLSKIALPGNAVSNTDFVVFIGYFRRHFPYAILGIFFFHFKLVLEDYSSPHKRVVLGIAFLATLATISIFWFFLDTVTIYSYSYSLSIFSLFYFSNFKDGNIVRKLSTLSFGIYLVHPLFIEGFQKTESYLGVDINSVLCTATNFILGLTCSFLLSHVLYKTPRTRFLVA